MNAEEVIGVQPLLLIKTHTPGDKLDFGAPMWSERETNVFVEISLTKICVQKIIFSFSKFHILRFVFIIDLYQS